MYNNNYYNRINNQFSLNENINNVINGNLDENSERDFQPKAIKLNLKAHQLTLLNSMKKIENNMKNEFISSDGNYAIVGDKVGSGKSIVILSLISDNKEFKFSNTRKYCNHDIQRYGYSYSDFQSMYLDNSATIINSNLIVVPHGIFEQWKKYINDFTDLNLYCVSKKNEILSDVEKYNNYDIVLCKSSMYNKFTECFDNTNILKTDNQLYNNIREKYKSR